MAIAKKNNSSKPLPWLIGVLLLTFIVFSPSLKNGFTNRDDDQYVTSNKLITSLSKDNIIEIFKTENSVALNYHPLTILSLALDYKLSGYDPKTYHFTNLLFHLFNTALVFWFILLLSGNKVRVAVIVALFFGIHPMHVESVAWVSERKDVLYTFFFMSALICYYKYISHTGNQRWRSYIFILLLFILSLLSKGMAVVLPMIFVLIDWYVGRKVNRSAILEKLPLVALSIFFGLLAMRIQSNGALTKFETNNFLYASYGFINYMINLFLPIRLSCYYPYPLLTGHRLPVVFYVSFILVLGMLVLTYFASKRNKAVAFGLLFFSITIVLVSQLISVGEVIMADRYSYVSYIGLLFPIGMGYDRLQKLDGKSLDLYKKVSNVLLIVAVIVCIWLTNDRIKVWKNSDSLWTDVINKYPSDGLPYFCRSGYLLNKSAFDVGQNKIPENEYARAVNDINSYIKLRTPVNVLDYKVFFNRAYALTKLNRYDNAIADYTIALKMKPDLVAAKENRALLYNAIHDYDKALADFNELISADPTNPYYYKCKSVIYSTIGNVTAAIENNNKAIALNRNAGKN